MGLLIRTIGMISFLIIIGNFIRIAYINMFASYQNNMLHPVKKPTFEQSRQVPTRPVARTKPEYGGAVTQQKQRKRRYANEPRLSNYRPSIDPRSHQSRNDNDY